MKRFLFSLPVCLLLSMLPTSIYAQGVEWAKWIQDNYTAGLSRLCRDSNDNVYVTGQLSANGQVDGLPIGVVGTYDMFLIKFNAAGEFQWSQRGGGMVARSI
ncbi:MAG: hypothetical protein J5I62_05055 [Flavobacteriales bacterium]|nr:hypothetical protein [Flavobacteriales bacterium]